MKIGVLGFQGDVEEHAQIIRNLQEQPVIVKRPYELEVVDGLILPGGESTTVGFLLRDSGLDSAIKKRASEGMPVWGTCMGAILLAKELIANPVPQSTLQLMDIAVRRNAYGRQRESFEETISIPSLHCEIFPSVFIRSPWIEKTGPKVETLATYQGKTVFARENNLLATTFHPEIAEENRIHEYFLSLIRKWRGHHFTE